MCTLFSLDTEKLGRLGADLTAAHTVVRLQGRVQFAGFDKWIEAKGDRMPLPNYKVDNLYLQVADFTGTKVLYEGLECLGKVDVQYLHESWIFFVTMAN